MCGIAGILRIHPPGQPPPLFDAIPEAWLDILDESIKHRGPDGRGRLRDRTTRPDGSTVDVALVHRRLSIIDHADGFQPMCIGAPIGGPTVREGVAPFASHGLLSREGAPYTPLRAHHCPRCAARGATTLAVVFNGCIYNHRDLRKELQAAGHEFFTDHSDTEVLLHGWSEWGLGTSLSNDHIPLRSNALFARTHDMFATVIWDGAKGSFVIGRDRFGQKPIYYCKLGPHGLWAIASTASGLAALSARLGVTTEVDAFAISRWIRFGADLHPPQKNVFQPPISTMVILDSEHRVEWYEMDEFSNDFFVGPWGEVGLTRSWNLSVGDVDRALHHSVEQRLVADVPVGCFLSGGIDSSLLAHYAARIVRGLKTFCVRMPDPMYDESGFAKQVAAVVGSDHETLECEAIPTTDLQAIVADSGLPFGDSSLLPTMWVSRAARQRVTVAIAGDGGDELFAGYDRYKAARLLGVARWPISLLPVSIGANPRSKVSRAARLADAARHDAYRDLISIFPESILRRVRSDGTAKFTREQEYWAWHPFAGIEAALDDDLARFLPNDLLRKTDTASMAVALEVRCPYLGPEVAGPASKAKARALMPHGQRKGLLRAVARKYFPPEIVDRPKQGFAIPIGDWFRSDYGGMRQLLLDHLTGPEPFGPDHLGINDMINMAFVRKMLKEHDAAGEKSLWPWRGRDHSQRLYMLLVLSIWAKWLGELQGGK